MMLTVAAAQSSVLLSQLVTAAIRTVGTLGEQQGKLGEQQGELGRQQAELAQKATRAMKQILDDAIKRGIAQPEPQEPGSASL